tara:strand:+ start:276 stop:734 length:459 start_codon:yes stop_codon:yes gene_type:complete
MIRDAGIGRLAPQLLDPLVAAATPAIVAITERVLNVIVLVIAFCRIEGAGLDNRRTAVFKPSAWASAGPLRSRAAAVKANCRNRISRVILLNSRGLKMGGVGGNGMGYPVTISCGGLLSPARDGGVSIVFLFRSTAIGFNGSPVSRRVAAAD